MHSVLPILTPGRLSSLMFLIYGLCILSNFLWRANFPPTRRCRTVRPIISTFILSPVSGANKYQNLDEFRRREKGLATKELERPTANRTD